MNRIVDKIVDSMAIAVYATVERRIDEAGIILAKVVGRRVRHRIDRASGNAVFDHVAAGSGVAR